MSVGIVQAEVSIIVPIRQILCGVRTVMDCSGGFPVKVIFGRLVSISLLVAGV